MSLKRHMAASPPERSLDASAIYGSRTTRKHPFQFQKRNSAGKNKKIGKGFFWWGERARAPAGVGAELRDFLGNRFGLRRKIAPGLSYSNTTPPSQGVYVLYRISIFEVNLQLAEDWIYYVFTNRRHSCVKRYRSNILTDLLTVASTHHNY